MALTKETRDALPDSDFAVPGKRALPIHDVSHTRMAHDMVERTKDLTPAERKEARSKIMDRAKTLGIDTKDWEKGTKLAASVSMTSAVSAMSLNIPKDEHPNKMPFSGILTRIGEPSDAAPEGSGGKRITISLEAAEKALGSLLGMAVDYKPGFDGHAPQSKIGLIESATIDGNAIRIGGFVYVADFPDEAAEIKASQDVLGFSYEARNLYTNDPDADPCVITECTFTGAAILLKAKAAYRSTSLAAAAAEDDEMTPEMKAALDKLAADQLVLTTGLASIAAAVAKLAEPVSAANLLPKVEPHATALEGCANAMEAAGIGGDPSNGHAVVLRKMAGDMRAEAAGGRMPARFSMYAAADKPATVDTAALTAQITALVKPLSDGLAAMSTKLADLQAAAAKDSVQPERKTLAPSITALLAKGGIEVPGAAGDKIDLGKLDVALKDMAVEQRLHVKTSLRAAGLLA